MPTPRTDGAELMAGGESIDRLAVLQERGRVKKSEPMKNVRAEGCNPTASAYCGTAPSPNRLEPTMKRVAIHHLRIVEGH